MIVSGSMLFDEGFESQANELRAHFLERHGDAILGQDVTIDLHRQRLAVDQHAVAIEDDMFEHIEG